MIFYEITVVMLYVTSLTFINMTFSINGSTSFSCRVPLCGFIHSLKVRHYFIVCPSVAVLICVALLEWWLVIRRTFNMAEPVCVHHHYYSRCRLRIPFCQYDVDALCFGVASLFLYICWYILVSWCLFTIIDYSRCLYVHPFVSIWRRCPFFFNVASLFID